MRFPMRASTPGLPNQPSFASKDGPFRVSPREKAKCSTHGVTPAAKSKPPEITIAER
jgi:hypothetical protein